MSANTYECPVCGKEASFLHFRCELVPMPAGTSISDLKRRPPFGKLMRVFVVNCPEHGKAFVQRPGHHISTIPKKRI